MHYPINLIPSFLKSVCAPSAQSRDIPFCVFLLVCPLTDNLVRNATDSGKDVQCIMAHILSENCACACIKIEPLMFNYDK